MRPPRRSPTHVEDLLRRQMRQGPLHFTLIDPEKQGPEESAAMAKAAAGAGSHAVLVGGSTVDSQALLDGTVKAIKKASGLPVILFPGAHTQLSAHADAILFMSLLNSRSRQFLVAEQVRGAPAIDKLGMEAIPMGYLVVEPGGTVGRVGEADLLRRDDLDGAVSYALAAQFFGMRFVYLEAGSGADAPVPAAMIRAVKKAVRIPLIVGGGIKTPEAAKEAIEAGADVIVTGTLVEGVTDVEKTLGDFLMNVVEKLRREIRRHLMPPQEN